jgi:hypothetical protein
MRLVAWLRGGHSTDTARDRKPVTHRTAKTSPAASLGRGGWRGDC